MCLHLRKIMSVNARAFFHFEKVIHKGNSFDSLAIKGYKIIKFEIFYLNIDVFKTPTNTSPNYISFFLFFSFLNMVWISLFGTISKQK
jgi:hypothetical protein